MTVGAIVLAAGSARRMGSDKLRAELAGKPLVRHIIDAVASAGLPWPIVAVPSSAAGLADALGAAVHRVDVPDHALGMGHSIAAAVQAIPDDWTAVLICLGDMPFIRPATLAAVAARAGPAQIVIPSFEGQRGNPLAWGRAFFADLARLEGDRGGRALLDRFGATTEMFECDDPGICRDIDTPEALAEARRFTAS